MSQTRFYVYRQNNSGGSFDIDDATGIGPKVWIEANDMNHSIERAQSIGIYFNGVEDGRDCVCCGDRWSKPWSDNGENLPKINDKYDFNWWNTVYIHYINGSIERITEKQRLNTIKSIT